jgi:excisionase family DNA binding protein
MQDSVDDSPWLTVEQVAERLQVPVKTVRYWRHLGTGPRAVRVGRFIRYHIDDLAKWERALPEYRGRTVSA